MVKVVSAPSGSDLSDKFKVFVRESAGEWQELSVYLALCPVKGQANMPPELFAEFNGLTYPRAGFAKPTCFAGFEYSGAVEIKAVYSRNADNLALKPESYNLDYAVHGNTVVFKINSADNIRFVTIQADDKPEEAVHIFVNDISEFKPAYDNVIHFTKGIYDVDNCEYIHIDEHGNPVIDGIKDNTYVYLDDGAVVRAAFILSGVKNVKIDGRGIISLLHRCYGYDEGFSCEPIFGPFRSYARPIIYIKSGCSDIEISGVITVGEFRNVTVRNSDNIILNNVKMLSHSTNADGVNCVNANNVQVHDCFIHSHDDCICMYTSYDSIPALNDEGYPPHAARSCNYEISGCVFWTICRPFVFGGHATKNSVNRDLVSNIHVNNCEIMDVPYCISSHDGVKYWSGYFRILSQSEALVRDIVFENINAHLTDGYLNQPVHIEVRESKDASYSESGGYKIENVLFKNINFYNYSDTNTIPCFFKATNLPDGYGIDGITFDNVTFNGQNLKDLEGTLIETEGSVKNIIIK